MLRLVLFDIDGTLLLTAGAGRRAITRALARVVGDTAGFDAVRFDGKTDPQIVAELLDRAGHPQAGEGEFVRQLCDQYLAMLEQELGRSPVTLMPGIPPLLDRLERERGVLLGLLTGNLARGAALKLSAAGLAPDRFRVGAFGSDSAHRPDLPPIAARRAAAHFGREPRGREIVIIGDTPADVTCGRGVGARAIGVATGAYPADALAGAGADTVFADLQDTESVLEAILA
ncbi:MAG TPA: HAD family hydrolase [Gemmatimonadales bacterium]|jgi:phosphoglycolate phosphatase-like HAD superfamily hydrolase|nr:HAD family hydrolase [Gemmatimonadales bacterium]